MTHVHSGIALFSGFVESNKSGNLLSIGSIFFLTLVVTAGNISASIISSLFLASSEMAD